MFALRQTARLAPAAVAVFLAACSSSVTDTTGTTTAAMTQAEANTASDVVVNDMASESEGATASNTSTALFYSAPSNVAFAGASIPWWAGCSPAPTHTLVGSTVTFVFTNCVANRLVPLETITRNGQVAITAQAGLRSVVYTAFKKDWQRVSFRTGLTVTSSETRTGTHQVTRDDGTTLTRAIYGATAADPFQTDFVAADTSTGTHLKKWNTVFTADVAGSIVPNQPLPAGKYAITGSSDWTRTKAGVTKTWSFVLSTGADGVHYNPACTAAGPNFDSGTMTIVATSRTGTVTTLVITFTGCGQYTVTKS